MPNCINQLVKLLGALNSEKFFITIMCEQDRILRTSRSEIAPLHDLEGGFAMKAALVVQNDVEQRTMDLQRAF